MRKEGFGIIAVLAFFAALFGYLYFQCDNILMAVFAGMTFILALFSIYFFRDPLRKPPSDTGVIVSPADGRVVEVVEIEEPIFMGEKTTRVAIFLSLFNVHVNYVPFAGIVDYIKYSKGKYLRADRPEASEENVHTFIGLKTEYGKLVFKQSVGIIARRIICYLHLGDEVTTGQKFGLMKFGSRMEVYVPSWATVNVKKGDRLRAAESVIATINEK
ncbi:MAG: phosphatidylserine decarboxylase family protein [Actinobacteria bacterium]|nr:phosphatidylserine decarboxylase family protein [Actinomycetota bacterium]